MAEVELRASEEVCRRLEPWLAAVRRAGAGGPALCLVERGREAPARGLAVVFGRDELPAVEALLRAWTGGGDPSGHLPPDLLTGRRGNALSPLSVREIRCFRSEGDTVTAELPAGAFEVEPRLYELEGAYRSRGFVRIAKSVIVNVAWVAEIVPWLGGRLLLEMKDRGTRLEVARSYVPDFKRFLGLRGDR
jgi:DNA-binding LytR/AlgR family response regulator